MLRVSITMNEGLVDPVYSAVAALGFTRSRLLAENRATPPAMRPSMRAAARCSFG
jgi:hypothetical protein